MARVHLLAPEDVAVDQRTLLLHLNEQGALINMYRAMAHSPVALQHFLALLSAIWDGALTARQREIAILSVVSASDSPYPLGWHLGDAQAAGLTTREIDAIVTGEASMALPRSEALIAEFASTLALEARVEEATYQPVAEILDQRQIVELTMLVGLYRLVAGLANTLQIDLDEEPARLLEQHRLSQERQP